MMKVIVLLLVLFSFVRLNECKIVNWTNPMVSRISGSGWVKERINEGSTGNLGIQIQATTDKLPYPFPMYSIIQNPTGYRFSINQDHGYLFLNYGTLDYEKSSRIVLVIKVDDAEAVGTATCTIQLIDLNDNTPYFPTKNATVVVDNNVSGGHPVVSVKATDNDATSPNNDVKYAITNGNTNGDFSIGKISGDISVTHGKILDRDRTATYNLLIIATDGGLVPRALSSSIVVNVCVGHCHKRKAAVSACNKNAGNFPMVVISTLIILIKFQ